MVCSCTMPAWDFPFPDDVVVLVARSCAFTTYILVVCGCLLLLRKSKGLCNTCLATMRSAAQQRTHDDMDMEVNNMVSTFRAQRGWEFLVIVGIIYFLYVVNTSRKLHGDNVWGEFDVELMRTTLRDRGMVQRLLRSIFFFFLTYRGHCSCIELYIIQVLSYCDFALQLWTSPDTHVFASWLGFSILSRVLMAFVVGNVPLTMLLNAMHSVGMIVRVISSSRTNELERFFGLEVGTCCVAVGVSALFESLFRRQMRATLEASLATESERTAKELLSLVCDAVVTLDEDLRVKQRSPALEALLFRNTAYGLCGVHFEELVCEDNCDRFEAFMADRSRVQSLHLHLRDASGTAVAVQLFHSRLRGLGGQISHLVGIHEEGGGERTRQPPNILLSEDLDTWTLPTAGREDQFSSSSVMSLSSEPSDSSETAFTVDAASPRLTMLSCTPSFTALTGPMERGDILHWVARNDADRLLALVQAARVGGPCSDANVTFKFPHSRHSGLLCARCEAHLFIEDSDDGRVRVQVTLTDIQIRRRRRRPASNRGTRRGQIHRLSL